MNKFLFFLPCFFLFIGTLSVSASADEVSIVPNDTFELYSSLSDSGSLIVQEVKRSTSLYPFTDSSCDLGTSSLVPDSVYLMSTNASSYLDSVKSVYPSSPSFNYKFRNFVVTLDMSDNINGYYRYSFDLYFGLSGGFVQWADFNATVDLTPTYTFSSAPLFISDSEDGLHCTVYLVGQSDFIVNDDYTPATGLEKFSLVHIFVESTFFYDSSYGTDIVFNLSPWFESNISALSFNPSVLPVDRSFRFVVNNRVISSLVGNVDPPVTPTSTVTPYPGQDTQESIQQGVSNIEGQINQLTNVLNPYVSPIPTPPELTIDETPFAEFESMTFPDISEGQPIFSSLWDVFEPLLPYVFVMGTSLILTFFVMWILRGGWL